MLASSLIELIIHIAEEVITKGILKQNFINDQWDDTASTRSQARALRLVVTVQIPVWKGGGAGGPDASRWSRSPG